MTKVVGTDGQTSLVERDVLNNAQMAGFDRGPVSPEAEAWVEHLLTATLAYEAKHHPRSRARRAADLKAFRLACGAFGHDLVCHSVNHDALGFMYRPLNRVELANTLVSSNHFENLIPAWIGLGWLEHSGFINAFEDFEGAKGGGGYSKVRRYRATMEFLTVAQRLEIEATTIKDHFELSYKHADIIQVRNKKTSRSVVGSKAQRVRMDGPKLQACREQVEKLNSDLLKYDYSLSHPPAVRRLFNCADRTGFDFDLGGRVYCISDDNWMEQSPEERALITIDGERTAEIDVSASHLTILYGLCEVGPESIVSFYRIEGYPRDLIKKLIVTSLGKGRFPTRWPKGFNEEFEATHGWQPKKRYKLKDVLAAIKFRHPVLGNLQPDVLDWANLQYEESECFISAMDQLFNDNIPSLPVHDSLIVKCSDIRKAHSVLEGAYRLRFGFNPVITMPSWAANYT
tara:strand:+ start:1610 stop:2980 length:1371 start_codon:yes stop_codon:yes gene_type:complete